MSTFQFQPLPSEQSQAIRVLHLSPGAPGAALSGYLQTVSLDDAQFEALSYEWGHDQERHHALWLEGDDGGAVQITEALHTALSDLRHQSPSTATRAIWADGICVNQDDLEERAQQVAIMELIYRRASRVVTYIGPEKDHSSDAIKLGLDLRQYAVLRDETPDRSTPGDLIKAGFPTSSDPAWQALHSLFLRAWASRCWCAVEFLQNKNLTMMCGRTELPWTLLADLCHVVFMRRLPVSVLPKEDPLALTECLTHMQYIREDVVRLGMKFNLMVLLRMFHPFRATDPRDKIYAILGLAADRETLALAVDYTAKPEDVYFSAMQKGLEGCSDANFLSHNFFGNKSLDLPSWVPDWSTWKYGALGVAHDEIYSASGTTKSEFSVHMEERRLDAKGSLIDRITSLGSPIGPHYRRAHHEDIKARHEWLAEQEELVSSLEPYPDGMSVTEVLWRTLIGNLTFNKTRAKNGYQHLFEAHKKRQEDLTEDDEVNAKEFIDAVRRKSRTRRLATTSRGYLAAVPEESDVGDWVCLLHGARHLFVIRQKGQNFSFIGPAYVQGLMDGEFLRLSERYEARTISLV